MESIHRLIPGKNSRVRRLARFVAVCMLKGAATAIGTVAVTVWIQHR
ncbi:hypothetical protein ACWEO1_19255 [Kitasatospora cineracea]